MRSELVELKNQISLELKAQVDANVKNTTFEIITDNFHCIKITKF